jgi:hypothetical protein
MLRQPEDARHVAAADLGRRFADFAIELSRLFDDEHARGGMLALDHQRRGRARERAADDHDIVIKHHAVWMMPFCRGESNANASTARVGCN